MACASSARQARIPPLLGALGPGKTLVFSVPATFRRGVVAVVCFVVESKRPTSGWRLAERVYCAILVHARDSKDKEISVSSSPLPTLQLVLHYSALRVIAVVMEDGKAPCD